jgi:hypothetical protein
MVPGLPVIDSNKAKGRPALRANTGIRARNTDDLRLTQSIDGRNTHQSTADCQTAELKAIQVKSAHPCVGDEHTPRPTRIPHERTAAVFRIAYYNVSICSGQLDASAIIHTASCLPPMKIDRLYSQPRHRIPPV